MNAYELPFKWMTADFAVKDPGTGKLIPFEKGFSYVPLTIAAGASETRYLPKPPAPGLFMFVEAVTIGAAGTCAVTGLNTAAFANSTLTSVTLSYAGQVLALMSTGIGSACEWARISLADFPMAVDGGLYQTYVPLAAPQALSGTGVVVNLTSYRTNWTTTGASQTATLANGVKVGQLKRIQNIVDGGSGILTPASLFGGTTITFTNVGDYCVLGWNGTAWVAIELGNDADGATAAVLA